MAGRRVSWWAVALAAAAIGLAALGAAALAWGLHSLSTGQVPRPPGTALQAAGGGILPFAAGAAALAVLVLTLGYRMLGVVLAVVTAVAVLQASGGLAQYVGIALALGLGLAAVNARPAIAMPRSVAILAAAVAGAVVAASDMTPFAAAMLYAAQLVAALIVQALQAALSAEVALLAPIVLIVATSYIARAAARAPGIAGTVLSAASAYLGVVVGAQALYAFLQAAAAAYAYVAIFAAGVVALVDMLAMVERMRPEALVWAGALAIMVRATLGISLAPVLASLAGLAAIVAAFTLDPRHANTAMFLAIASLVA
jgi:hypothetical protein